MGNPIRWGLQSREHILASLLAGAVVALSVGAGAGAVSGHYEAKAHLDGYMDALCDGVYVMSVDRSITIPSSLQTQCESVNASPSPGAGLCVGLTAIMSDVDDEIRKLHRLIVDDGHTELIPMRETAHYIFDALADIGQRHHCNSPI